MPSPTSPIDLDQLHALAKTVARDAGRLAIDQRHLLDSSTSIASTGTTKSSAVDLVTAADRSAEAHILSVIRDQRPDDGVLGEEGSDIESRNGVRWIIDPIDGTTNFVYNIPDYSVSVAVEFEEETVVGVVYQPSSESMYSAVLGRGASKNDQPLTVNNPVDVGLALVATGFGYLAERRTGQAEVLVQILSEIRDIRRFGSAALDLCYLAEGRVDAYYERGLNEWDMAAGVLIAAEAGADVGNLRGDQANSDFLLAACPGVFDALRDLLVRADADQKI